MKNIGNIYLTWRKAKGSRRISVGIIKSNSTQGVRFNYLSKGVEEAKKYGFSPYEGFPDSEKEYDENVLDIFGQRIIKSERSDTETFYSFWEVDYRSKEDKYYMLAQTQGLLPTDNFEFLADFKPNAELSFVTEISGLSHTQILSEELSKGDMLRYELESDNEYDPKAVKVFKGEKLLGYIKTVHSRVFYYVSKPLNLRVKLVEKNGVVKRAFVHVFA